MSRYLAHAITGPLSAAPATGPRGQRLRWIGTGALGVWVTEWSGEPVLTRDDAFAHHDLVARLCDAGPGVPVRFGTWLASEAAARASLDEGAARFAAALDRLADRSEIALTLLWLDDPGPSDGLPAAADDAPGGATAASPGRAFLDRKRALQAASDERRQRAERLAAALVRDLTTDQGDVRHESCPSAEVAVSLSLLVRKPEAHAHKARAQAAVAALSGVRGVVSGPWPPYSFTEDLPSARSGVVDGS